MAYNAKSAVWMLGLLLTLPAAHFRHRQGVELPDVTVTPGKVRTTNAAEICAPSFRTGPYRKTTAAMKKAVCKAYGVKDCPHEGALEIDHLLPLELGGLDDVGNLWPQPAPDFHWKDDLENTLKRKVCKEKSLKLSDAQQCIMRDWIACYEVHVGPLPKM